MFFCYNFQTIVKISDVKVTLMPNFIWKIEGEGENLLFQNLTNNFELSSVIRLLIVINICVQAYLIKNSKNLNRAYEEIILLVCYAAFIL